MAHLAVTCIYRRSPAFSRRADAMFLRIVSVAWAVVATFRALSGCFERLPDILVVLVASIDASTIRRSAIFSRLYLSEDSLFRCSLARLAGEGAHRPRQRHSWKNSLYARSAVAVVRWLQQLISLGREVIIASALLLGLQGFRQQTTHSWFASSSTARSTVICDGEGTFDSPLTLSATWRAILLTRNCCVSSVVGPLHTQLVRTGIWSWGQCWFMPTRVSQQSSFRVRDLPRCDAVLYMSLNRRSYLPQCTGKCATCQTSRVMKFGCGRYRLAKRKGQWQRRPLHSATS